MSQNNNTTIEGNLTAPVELRFTNSGKPVANLRIAQTDSFMRDGQRHETTEFMNVVVWNDQAENVAMSLITGDRIVVIGKVKQRKATIDGSDRYFTELHADVVAVALRWATVEGIARQTKAGKQLAAVGADVVDDEGPF